MDRIVNATIDATERAAGVFLAAIATLTFVSVLLRLVNYSIPDWYDVSRLMLGVCVFWGIASTSYRGQHIKVDILWEMVGPTGKRIIDIFATLVLLAFMAAFSFMLVFKVDSGFRSGESTFDVRMPVWPFHLLAALGIFFATVLIMIRLVRLIRGADTVETRRIDEVQ